MKTIKISDYDSTCFDASLSAGHLNEQGEEYAAIPDIYSSATRATSVARKHRPDYILLEFPDREDLRIASFVDSSSESAISEAKQAMDEDGKAENDIAWWTNVD